MIVGVANQKAQGLAVIEAAPTSEARTAEQRTWPYLMPRVQPLTAVH
jgi:hypothetical protein